MFARLQSIALAFVAFRRFVLRWLVPVAGFVLLPCLGAYTGMRYLRLFLAS